MDTTKLSSRRRVVLTKSVRGARGRKPGSRFVVEELVDGVWLRSVRPFKTTQIEDVVGFLKFRGKAKTLGQMEQAIAKEVRVRHNCGRT